MKNFQKNLKSLEASDTQVLGVSMDSPFANKAFADSIGVTFPLLSDSSGKTIEEYGLMKELPLEYWFRHELRDYVGATLGTPSARIRRHLRGELVDHLLADHWSGRRNHGQRLWLLLTLELFLNREQW